VSSVGVTDHEEKQVKKTRRRRIPGTKKARKPRPRPRPARSTAYQKNMVPILESTPMVIKLVQSEEIERLKCPHCSMVFKTSVSCDKHITKCSNVDGGFVCKVCKNNYRTRLLLVQHIWCFHRENRTHKCPLCPMQYCQRKNLNIHIETNHPSEPDCVN